MLNLIRRFFIPGLVTLIMVFLCTVTLQGQAQTPTQTAPQPADTGLLSLGGAKRLMDQAKTAISSQNYPLAIKTLQEARDVANEVSNLYQDLAGSFSAIDNNIARQQRSQALAAAEMRDQVTYQLALVYRSQNQPDLAVPLLVEVVKSQQPTRTTGQKAYGQLYELGFVKTPYPEDNTPTPSVK